MGNVRCAPCFCRHRAGWCAGLFPVLFSSCRYRQSFAFLVLFVFPLISEKGAYSLSLSDLTVSVGVLIHWCLLLGVGADPLEFHRVDCLLTTLGVVGVIVYCVTLLLFCTICWTFTF